MKTLSVSPAVFESVRLSVDRLPADGDSFTMDKADFAECQQCAHSHSAAMFAVRYKQYAASEPVTVQKKAK